MLESSKQKLASSPCHSATPQLCFPSSQTNPQVSELNISNIMEFSPQKPQPTSPNETIKTYCRLRPCEKPISYSLSNQNKKLKITSQTSTHEYTFNKVFLSTSTNLDIFNEICKPLINDLFLKNKSTLLFTYGLSNSGKTHTIIGDLSNPGILPFSLVVIMDYILSYYNNKIEVKCVYVEIYNEKIYDLLSEKKNRLHLKECNKLFVLDSKTTIKHITSLNDFENALNAGVNRKVHLSTKLNSQSSRSHTIFKVMLSTGATFSIVDLAGAERSNKADTVGKGLKETCKINTSLMTLGRCIDAMEHNSKFNKVDKKIPVPIRESKLTKMFQEYFTGEHNVVMITNINPSKDDFLENRNVFAYACKAMKVKPICSWFNINNNNINYSKSKTNNGYVSDISSDGNGDVGINEQLKNDYEVLLGKYESKVEENDDLEEKEKMLIEKIKLMEKDFIIRQHNEIIKRGNDFIKKMWSDFNSTSLSLNTCDNDNETNSNSNNNNNDIEDNIIVLRNPLYKEDNNDKAQCENKNDKNVLECMFNVNNVEIFAEEKKEEEVVVNCFENTECFSIECSNNNIISNIVKDKKPTKKRKPYTKKEEKIINIKVNEDTIENEGSNNNSHNSDDNDEEDNVNKNKKKKAKTKKKNNKKQNEKQIIQNNNITTNYNNDSSNSDNEKEDIKKNKKGNNKKQKRKVKSKVKYKNSHDTINNSSDEDNNNNNSSNSDNEREEIKKNNKKGKAKVKQRKAKSKAKYNNDSSDNNSSDEDNNNNSSNTESKDSINEDDVQDYPVYKGTRKNKNESFMSDDDESKDSINDNSQSSSDNDDNDSDYKIHQKIKLNKNKKGVAHKNNNDGNVKNKKAKPKPCNKKAKNKKK